MSNLGLGIALIGKTLASEPEVAYLPRAEADIQLRCDLEAIRVSTRITEMIIDGQFYGEPNIDTIRDVVQSVRIKCLNREARNYCEMKADFKYAEVVRGFGFETDFARETANLFAKTEEMECTYRLLGEYN